MSDRVHGALRLLGEADRPARLLVVAAHPLDADEAMGGTVRSWTRAGTVAHLACCTSGEAGDDARADPLVVAATREAEQRAAAAILGYEAVTFLHRPTGAIAADLALREQLVRLLRAFRPTAVATHDPSTALHPAGRVVPADHRAAGLAALDALEPAADAMAFPQLVTADGLEPVRVARLHLFGAAAPNAAGDIASSLEPKLAALAAHASAPGGALAAAERAEREARATGRLAGIGMGEALAVLDLVDGPP